MVRKNDQVILLELLATPTKGQLDEHYIRVLIQKIFPRLKHGSSILRVKMMFNYILIGHQIKCWRVVFTNIILTIIQMFKWSRVLGYDWKKIRH
jgi:hypothetical protein